MSGPALWVDGVTVEARGRAILRDVSFTLEHGERVALIGPNGAGKSTLLRVLAGILRPAAGRVELDGTPIASAATDREVARRLAVVPQQTALPFSMRVEEVVALGRLPHESAAARGLARGPGGGRGRDRPRGPRPPARAATRASSPWASGSWCCSRSPSPRRRRSCSSTSPPCTSTCATRWRRWSSCATSTSATAPRSSPSSTTWAWPRTSSRGWCIIEHGRIIADGTPAEVLTDERIREMFGVEPALVRLAARRDGG